MVTLNPWGTAGAPVETMKDGSLNLNLYVHENWGSGWTFAQAVSTATVTSGSFDLADLFKMLVWDGVLTGDEYLHKVQFGAEVVSGSGKLHINSLAYQPTTAPTLQGTAAHDTFDMTTRSGQHAEGRAGQDTARFAGVFADFQVKVPPSGQAMVMRNHNISTLNTLSTVEILHFIDGTYETASHISIPF